MADIPVTPGSGKDVATDELTRDGLTEDIQLEVIADGTTGTEAHVNASGLEVAVDGTAASGVSQDTGGTGTEGWLSSVVKNLRAIATAIVGTLTVGGTVGISGTVPVVLPTTSTAAQTNVSASSSSVTITAANSSRKGMSIVNDALDANLYLSMSGAASTTNFAFKIGAGGTFVLPIPWTGLINGIWDTDTNGTARVTEFT